MKKFLSVLLIVVMVFTFAACGTKDGGNGDAVDYDAIPDTCESADGTYVKGRFIQPVHLERM